MRIYVKELPHISRDDGEHLHQIIEDHWDNEQLVLDFDGVIIASIGFLDEAIGLFALDFPLEVVKERILIENINENDRKLLNMIVSLRVEGRNANI